MQKLLLAAAAGMLLVSGCAPERDLAAGTSGRNGSADLGKEVAPGTSVQRASVDVARDFVAGVIGDTEDVWATLFAAMGKSPPPMPRVVLFREQTVSACGRMHTAVGPFYCPSDHKVYLDTAFLSHLSPRFDGPGNFAQAYLIVHALSHHLQSVLGTTQRNEQAAANMEEPQRKQLQMRLELQADCYTGVWAFSAQKRNLLEPGDLEQGVPLAVAVGDPMARGDAKQRTRWFEQGFATGDPRQCDTFAVAKP